MNDFLCSRRIDSALAIAPRMPSAAGVSTTCAPSALSSRRRSMLMLSGMVRMSLYPLAAHTNASAMPVLPLVGSTMTVSRSIFPSRSAASIIATPMRSLTLESGLKNSHLASTTACSRGITRLIRTSGVPPMVSVMSLKIRPWGSRGIKVPQLVSHLLFDDILPRKGLGLLIHYPTRHVNRLALGDRDDDVA